MSYALNAAIEARRTYLARACLALEEGYRTDEQAKWLRVEDWLALLESNGLARDHGANLGWLLTETGREFARRFVAVKTRRAS
jgi:hypothetical protein